MFQVKSGSGELTQVTLAYMNHALRQDLFNLTTQVTDKAQVFVGVTIFYHDGLSRRPTSLVWHHDSQAWSYSPYNSSTGTLHCLAGPQPLACSLPLDPLMVPLPGNMVEKPRVLLNFLLWFATLILPTLIFTIALCRTQ